MDRKVAKLKSILSKVALRFEFRPSITALRNSTSLLERLVHSLPEMKEKNCTYVELSFLFLSTYVIKIRAESQLKSRPSINTEFSPDLPA